MGKKRGSRRKSRRKSRKKSRRKSRRKSRKKSRRKSRRKSRKKSRRKSRKKSRRKSKRKSKRKSRKKSKKYPTVIKFQNTPYGVVKYKQHNVRLARDNDDVYFKLKNKKYVQKGRNFFVRANFGMGSWTVYTKDGCPYCEQAVKTLQNKGEIVIVKRGEDYKAEIDSKLRQAGRSDFRTWPKIFRPDGSFLGGNGDLQKSLN